MLTTLPKQTYGILYAHPESFAAPHRGTGDALCAVVNHIDGFIAPLIKIDTTLKTTPAPANTVNGSVSVIFPPLYLSFASSAFCGAHLANLDPTLSLLALFVVSALLTSFLPIEVRQPHTSPGVFVSIPMCFCSMFGARLQDAACLLRLMSTLGKHGS